MNNSQDRSKTNLTMITTKVLRDIAKKQDEIVLNKLFARCDDCLSMLPIKQLYLEEPPLEIINEYQKQGNKAVFQIRQQCVKLICQECREMI